MTSADVDLVRAGHAPNDASTVTETAGFCPKGVVMATKKARKAALFDRQKSRKDMCTKRAFVALSMG